MKKLFTVAAAMVLGTSAFAQNASFPLEGNFGYINFHEDSNFKDTYYYGGSTGFNFSENAGIRGYYWKALQNEEVKKNDHLEIYGAEAKVKAPLSETFKPYLVVGGGLLKPYGDYTGDNGLRYTDDKFFGSAGAGLDLEFIDFLSVTGYARAMVSEFEQLDNIDKSDSDISTSWNYGGSINLNIGRTRDGRFISNPKRVVTPVYESDTYIADPKDRRIAELEGRLIAIEEKGVRDAEIEALKKELRQEFESNKSNVDSYDTNSRLESQIERLEARVAELNKIQAKQEAIIDNAKSSIKNNNSTSDNTSGQTIIVTDGNGGVTTTTPNANGEVVVNDSSANSGNGWFSGMRYNATEVIAGGQFGDESSGVIGLRPDWKMNNDKLRLLGELSANLADDTGINIFANLATDFSMGSADAVAPYVGLGAGFATINGDSEAAFNILLGTKINSVLDGRLTAQYDSRNFFDYNQLTVGYRLF